MKAQAESGLTAATASVRLGDYDEAKACFESVVRVEDREQPGAKAFRSTASMALAMLEKRVIDPLRAMLDRLYASRQPSLRA